MLRASKAFRSVSPADLVVAFNTVISDFNLLERRALTTLGSIYALRMLGLFIVLPVFAIYAETLQGSTVFLAGIAVGSYGLTQALLQIPTGWLSDRYGRRGVVWLGLLVFVIGSLIAGWAEDIYWMIIGRAVQGAGAISAALTAWVADLSRVEVRDRVMALIGILIGLSFILSLIAGPVLAARIGVDGIFYLVAALSALAMVVVWFWVPEEGASGHRYAPSWRDAMEALHDRKVLRLSLGAASIHMLLVANFMSLPLALRDIAGFPIDQHGWFYLLVLLAAALFLFPILRLARTQVFAWMRRSALLLAAVELMLVFVRHDVMLVGAVLVLFFIAFNLLEAQLPTQVSQRCSGHLKGISLGVFVTFQLLGAFFGGLLSGVFLQYFNAEALYIFLTIIMLFWYYSMLWFNGK